MKIALITYYYSSNNGAVMQTYALCRYLKELGHDVTLIDVRQDESANQPFYVKLLKYFIFGYRINKIIQKHYPKLTRRYSSIKELQEDPPEADYYIVGSDQTWNPDISKDLMMAFFLDFGDNRVRRMSYASSFGVSEWPISDESVTKRIKQLLHSYSAVSVREEQGKTICEKTFEISPQVVLDPTFLNEQYEEFNKGTKEKNLFLCYKLNRTADFWENTCKVGEIIGIKPTNLNYNYPKQGFRYCFPPSLRTWMRKFAEAKFVLTDSFHGVAFSIINRKQFVAILNEDGKNSRLLNLMKVMGLEDRIYPTVASMLEDQKWKQKIDYSKIEPIIKSNIELSREYLINALK